MSTDFYWLLKALKSTPSLIHSLNELLDQEISLPNIPFPTMGGKIFWDTLAEYGGWRVQQNEITKHCRVLDPKNIRRAWGTKNGMLKAIKSLKNSL